MIFKYFSLPVFFLFVLGLPGVAFASVTGTEFLALYNFFFDAATGYLGRALAIIGGLMGLGMGAATGRPVPALMGIVLAIFGTLGPQIINTMFASAKI